MYLIVEGRTKKLDAETAIPWIKKQCKTHIKKLLSQTRPHIYRGVRGFFDGWGVVDPKSAGERKSANTSNHTTLLMDNLPSWKKYPKRSQSLICSTNHTNAQSYGTLHYVYPSDKCDIGIVPTTDVWDSFQFAWGTDVPSFNKKMKGHSMSDCSWSQFKNQLILFYEHTVVDQYKEEKKGIIKRNSEWTKDDSIQTINNLAKVLASSPGVRSNRMIYDYIYNSLHAVEGGKRPLSVIDWFDMYMKPQKNDFSMNNLSMKHSDNEIWIGSAPVFIVDTGHRDLLEKEGMF